MKIVHITLAIMTSTMLMFCNQNKETMENTNHKLEAIFPKGD